MKSVVSRRFKKLYLRYAARLVAIVPLVVVLVLPILARSSPVARIPALEPVGKEAGKRATAAVIGALRPSHGP